MPPSPFLFCFLVRQPRTFSAALKGSNLGIRGSYAPLSGSLHFSSTSAQSGTQKKKNGPPITRKPLHEELGRFHRAIKQKNAAWTEELFKKVPETPSTLHSMIDLHLELGNIPTAQKYADRFLSKFPPHYKTNRLLLFLFAAQKQEDKMLELFESLKKSETFSPGAFSPLVKYYAEQGNLVKVQALLDEMAQLNFPLTSSIYATLIQLFLAQGQLAKAEAYLDLQLTTNVIPKEESFRSLIKYYIAHDDALKAEGLLKKQTELKIVPHESSCFLLLSHFVQSEAYERTLMAYRIYSSYYQLQDAQLLFKILKILCSGKMTDITRTVLRRLSKVDPRFPHANEAVKMVVGMYEANKKLPTAKKLRLEFQNFGKEEPSPQQ